MANIVGSRKLQSSNLVGIEGCKEKRPARNVLQDIKNIKRLRKETNLKEFSIAVTKSSKIEQLKRYSNISCSPAEQLSDFPSLATSSSDIGSMCEPKVALSSPRAPLPVICSTPLNDAVTQPAQLDMTPILDTSDTVHAHANVLAINVPAPSNVPTTSVPVPANAPICTTSVPVPANAPTCTTSVPSLPPLSCYIKSNLHKTTSRDSKRKKGKRKKYGHKLISKMSLKKIGERFAPIKKKLPLYALRRLPSYNLGLADDDQPIPQCPLTLDVTPKPITPKCTDSTADDPLIVY